jgi:hypothetical protein
MDTSERDKTELTRILRHNQESRSNLVDCGSRIRHRTNSEDDHDPWTFWKEMKAMEMQE